ncbi:DASS family sodium-coupled anion symporter [Acinetobacter schindleri]|jgi:sodium-dependent dicarboxylate transporter 2/3/5|uniref:SLC13 family permease n=1 Tax=Acinetobacter TaxID=469 RepID=UPI000972BF10|nr:DASS family sodium-coupled anion symporter [Acinetobacter schindleri]APX62178.1 sodium-dependent dicarboxylate transporter protein [Acinetobacter schindleri]
MINQLWNTVWARHHKTKDLFKRLNPHFILSQQIQANSDSTDNIQSNTKQRNGFNGSYNKTQWLGLFLGPLVFAWLYFGMSFEGLSSEGQGVLALTAWLSIWWILEVLPLGITSLLPIVVMPMMGTLTIAKVTSSYTDPNIFLFLGGFAIAIAIEKWNLHERISLGIISFSGSTVNGLIYGFMFATAFLSMWISNVATVMMLLPIGMAIVYKIISLLKQEASHDPDDEVKFTKAIVFAIGFGGIIGGSATLIGTPPNLILAGLVKEIYGYEIGFAQWFIFAFPLCLILAIFTTFWLTKIAYPMKAKKITEGKAFIQSEKTRLGKMSYEEKAVAIIFAVTAFMWLTRTFIWKDIIPGISDTMIAITAAMALYAIPATDGKRLLNADSLNEMPWDVLLLVGGGLALAAGFSNTDLSQWIGQQLLLLKNMPYLIALLLTTALTISITQVSPNTAVTTIFVPIAATLALALDVHPLPLMTAAALGAGFAFMLPIGTPSQAVIFATGKVSIRDMLMQGTLVTILATLLIVASVYFIFPFAFGLDLFSFPEAWK